MLPRKSDIIRKRVLSHVHAKLDAAQKQCDAEHIEIDKAHTEAVEALERKRFQDKNDVVERLVENIIGKIM